MRRWWLVGGLALVLVLTGLGVGVAWRSEERPCGAAVRSYDAAGSASPFTGDAPAPLVSALARAGEVVGSRGHPHGEELQLTSYAAGLGVRVRDDDRFTLLDDDLRPRWSVAVGTRSSTFDADAEQYVVLTLPEDAAPELVALDLGTGERRWCTSLPLDAAPRALVGTQLLDDGSVVALLDDGDPHLVRAGRDGERWSVAPEAGRGDFVGLLDGERLVVGGSPLPDLLDPAALESRGAGDRVAVLDPATGSREWSRPEPAGTDVHVVGTATDRVLLARAVAGSAGLELVALDADGEEAWSTTPAPGTAFDATVRGDRVVVRAGATWSAYDAVGGRRLWRFEVPETPQFLPYGAVLDAMPSLDADTVLVGGTEALVTLDLRTGRRRATPLPTDGLATTYWPYRVVAPPGLLAVATNTGAVVVRR